MAEDMPELIVARHAECQSYSSGGDLQRQLVPQGERQSRRLGRYISENGLIPDQVVCSPAVRAKDTVRLALEQLDSDVPVEIEDRIAPGSSLQNHLEVLRERSADRLMITGHNPGFSYLASWLANGERSGIRVGRGDLRLFDIKTDWSELTPEQISLELEHTARDLKRHYS